MILNIIPASEPSLRKKSKPVKKIDKKIKKLIADMKETLVAQDDPEGIGLAAPQIGKNLRIFIMKPAKKISVIINPEVLEVVEVNRNTKQGNAKAQNEDKAQKSEGKVMEGCLSLPHYYSPIDRAEFIKMKFIDEKGKEVTKTYTGLEAQIVQHEIDHLNGVLFVDRSLEQKEKLFEYVEGEWEEVNL